MTQKLAVSRLIRVSVSLTQQAAQGQNLSSLLIMGNSAVIDVIERMRVYTDIDAIADDFGTTAPEYLAAVLWFEQRPQPTELLIGRWAQTASAGALLCAPLSVAQQVMSVWTAITNGGLTITIDSGSVQHVTGLDFSAQTNLNGVAAIIDAAVTGATVVWNAILGRFEFTSATTGTSSKVSFLTAPTSGVDISNTIAGRSTSSGAYVADGVAAETAVAATALFDGQFGQRWYGIQFTGLSPGANSGADTAALLAVSAYVEASNRKHIHGITTEEAGAKVAVDTTNIAYQVKQLAYKKTITQYSSSNPYAVASALARVLTTNWTGNNTTITLAYKQEPGIVAENLSETQATVLEGNYCLFFAAYDNDTAIIDPASTKTGSGDWIDAVIGADWLATAMVTALYNLLYTSPTKIPQTDAGMNILANGIAAVCNQGVNNGLLGAGIWQSAGFGALNQGDMLPKGFYIYQPTVASQNQADRAARKSVPFQVAGKLSGAVHSADVAVILNA